MSTRRRGYSLIELLATMGLTTSLLMLLAGSLTATMQHQRAAGEHLQRAVTQDRLARQFRADVHAARGLLPLDAETESNVQLRLNLGDYEVHYVREGRRLDRVEQASGGTRRREQYLLPPEHVRFEAEAGQNPALLLGDSKPTSHAPAWRVEAVLGSDRRWEGSDP